jgi:hypothetical protein
MKNNFIEKLDYSVDLDRMMQDLHYVESITEWPEKRFTKNGRDYSANQIGLNSRPGAEYPWYDANGSLYNKLEKSFLAREHEFTEWNPIGAYTKTIIDQLSEKFNIKFGRIRYMKLLPKTGLSIHPDAEPRYHLALQTSPRALFLDCTQEGDVMAKAYHIPADGYFYKVNTLREHTVFNGGWDPRIHLVLSDITC